MPTDIDKREHERKQLFAETTLEFSSGKYEARISDISLGGCYVDSIASVVEGEIITLSLASRIRRATAVFRRSRLCPAGFWFWSSLYRSYPIKNKLSSSTYWLRSNLVAPAPFCPFVLISLTCKFMVEIEEFPISLSESEITEPMVQIPSELPVLPLRDIVIYPFMIVPLFVSRDRSIRAVEQALKEDRMILLVSQKDVNKEDPEQNDLYTVGTVAIIMRMLRLPDGRIRILIQGLSRCQVDSVAGHGEYVKAAVTPISEPLAPENSLEVEALIRNVRGAMERAASLGKNISPEVLAIIANLDDAGRLADLSASNLELKVEDGQSVLDIHDPVPRLRRVNDLLSKEIDVLTVQQEINTQARADIDRSQREYFLRQQLKAIQAELGEGNELYEEIEQYRDKILKAKMPESGRGRSASAVEKA